MKKLLVLTLCLVGGLTRQAISQSWTPPPIPDALLQPATQSGDVILSFEGFDLSGTAAKWAGSQLPMTHQTGTTVSGTSRMYYKMGFTGSQNYYANYSKLGAVLEPNRDYTLSVLVCYNFPDPDSELQMGVRQKSSQVRDYNGDEILAQDVGGVMGLSGTGSAPGWVRWNYKFTSLPFSGTALSFSGSNPQFSGTAHFQVVPRFKKDGAPFNPDPAMRPTFCIADAKLIQHAPRTATTYSSTNTMSVQFAGSAGKFATGMQIWYQPTWFSGSTTVKVGTTGAMFAATPASNVISVRHDIASEDYRANVYFPSGILNGLKVKSGTSSDICILGNQNVTIGIQRDSLMVIVPHVNMDVRVRGRIGGKWNRFFEGHLVSADEKGGFCVVPDIQPGTGQLCAYTVPNHDNDAPPDFATVYNDTTFLRSETPNWEVIYHLKTTQRLGVGTFPPRKFDWPRSFEANYGLVQMSTTGTGTAVNFDSRYDIAICWETFMKGGWSAGGQSTGQFGGQYQTYDASLKNHIAVLKGKNLPVLLYLSPRFYSTNDMDAFIDEVERLRDEYDLDGVYYDGLPANWVASYHVMRETRRLFPEGLIVLHSSMSPPTYMPDMFCPFIDTYADITLRGETVAASGDPNLNEGIDWPFAKYGAAQFNLANCVGIIKAARDRWQLRIPATGHPLSSTKEIGAYFKSLHHGGRPRMAYSQDEALYNDYHTVIEPALESLWNAHKNDSDFDQNFFDVYYAPAAQSQTATYLDGIE